MRGICEPICDGVSIMGDMGGIAIHFNPGEEWHFHQDRKHEDRLLVDRGQDVAISMTVHQFYETFKVKEREDGA
ncbi:hypothetical protein [Selenomonas sp. AB3002]|jgi:hypothetical protein|uniref:hypothetical protein n=1 Tax=Selenomonas sp. AB3002 TaxID=1392502 RepID=UPI0004984472